MSGEEYLDAAERAFGGAVVQTTSGADDAAHRVP